MTKISIVLVVVCALVGCKNGSDCDKAIRNSLEVSKADLTKMPGVDDKMMQKMKDLGIKHCTDDKWSDDAVKCMSEAKTEAEAQGCYGKMTPEQTATMNKAAMELMTPPNSGSAATAAPK